MINSRPLSESSRNVYTYRIERTVLYINQNLSRSMTLTEIAGESGFSPFHFHRIFHALVGETPQDYINRLRLEKAANYLIKNPTLSKTEVAFNCGFSSSAVFARSFKKHFRVTASQYSQMVSLDRRFEHLQPSDLAPELPPLPEIQIRNAPAMRLAYFGTHKGYSRESIGDAWNKVFAWAQGHDCLTPDSNLVGICFDDPTITPKEKCRYYACVPVPEGIMKDVRANFINIPAGLRAFCHLECTPEVIPSTFFTLYRDWLPDSGYLPDDIPPYELYYYSMDAYQAGNYVLDVCIPVVPL
jgi:AraC family transcriptional regulator